MPGAARLVLTRLAGDKASVFLRFLAVGLLNTAFGYTVFSLLVWLDVLAEAALLLSTIAGMLFNFMTTGSLVFRNCDRRLFLRFAAVYGGIYLLNAGALRLLILSGISPFLAQAAILPFSVILTFFAMRSYVFRKPTR